MVRLIRLLTLITLLPVVTFRTSGFYGLVSPHYGWPGEFKQNSLAHPPFRVDCALVTTFARLDRAFSYCSFHGWNMIGRLQSLFATVRFTAPWTTAPWFTSKSSNGRQRSRL